MEGFLVWVTGGRLWWACSISQGFPFYFCNFFFHRWGEEEEEEENSTGGLLLVCSQGGTVYTSEPGSTGGSQEQIYDQWQFAFRRQKLLEEEWEGAHWGTTPFLFFTLPSIHPPILLYCFLILPKVFETNSSRVAKLNWMMKTDWVMKLDQKLKKQVTATYMNVDQRSWPTKNEMQS